MRLTATEVAAALYATAPVGCETIFERVSTDTREDLAGCLYVALAGERFDGHAFIADAVKKGASGVVHARGEVPGGALSFKVADTLNALGQLGLAARRKLACPVGAVTGSFGKTTTKEMAVELLTGAGKKVLATAGNLNNRVGMPKTLLGASGDETVAVLELGISLPGEMSALTKSLRPDAAAVTGVGPAHTEGLLDVATVAREKMSIAEGLPDGGTLILPHGHPLLKPDGELRERRIKVLTFGWDEGADFRGTDYASKGVGGSTFKVNGLDVAVALPGRHNAANALCAVALASSLGAELKTAGPLGRMAGAPLRGEVRRTAGGVNLLVDCYNANPGAVKAALETLAELAGAARKLAVLGEMRELGDLSASSHLEVGREAARAGVARLFLFGVETGHTKEGATDAGLTPAAVTIHETREEIARELAREAGPGDWVLIKGSRSTRLDELAELLSTAKGDGR